MNDESLVEIYRAGDAAQAIFLRNLLEERDVPVFQQAAGTDGIPAAQMGVVGYRMLIRRSDAETHAAAIAEAIQEFETTMGLESSDA